MLHSYRLDPVRKDDPDWAKCLYADTVFVGAHNAREARKIVAAATCYEIGDRPVSSPWLDHRKSTCFETSSVSDLEHKQIITAQSPPD